MPSHLPTFASRFLAAGLLTLIGTQAGCADIPSADLRTAGISATFQVAVQGGSTTVTGVLNADSNGNDYVALDPGDTLVVTGNGMTRDLVQINLLRDIGYSTIFSSQASANAAFTIALDRSASGNVSAPASAVTIPDAVSVTPLSGSFSRSGSDIAVTYVGGTSDEISYTVSGDCLAEALPSQALNGDPGTFTIAKGTLALPSNAFDTCMATLTVTRTRTGRLDPAYAGGSVTATQTATVTFESTP